jgi:hypothetical protein
LIQHAAFRNLSILSNLVRSDWFSSNHLPAQSVCHGQLKFKTQTGLVHAIVKTFEYGSDGLAILRTIIIKKDLVAAGPRPHEASE